MQKLGLLRFRANAASFSCPYRLQVRRLVAACKNSKVFMYKFNANQKFSKTINVRQISMLIEVNPLTVLLSSRSRFMFLNGY